MIAQDSSVASLYEKGTAFLGSPRGNSASLSKARVHPLLTVSFCAAYVLSSYFDESIGEIRNDMVYGSLSSLLGFSYDSDFPALEMVATGLVVEMIEHEFVSVEEWQTGSLVARTKGAEALMRVRELLLTGGNDMRDMLFYLEPTEKGISWFDEFKQPAPIPNNDDLAANPILLT